MSMSLKVWPLCVILLTSRFRAASVFPETGPQLLTVVYFAGSVQFK